MQRAGAVLELQGMPDTPFALVEEPCHLSADRR